MLTVARRSAVKARTVAANQIDAVVVTAVEHPKESLRGLTTAARVEACAQLSPDCNGDPMTAAAKQVLRNLASWHQVLTTEITELDTELKNRGWLDVLIVCCDELRGLPESIRATWPEATVQTCVVHLVRNSMRYTTGKHWSPITKATSEINTAATIAAAESRFGTLATDWEHTYPAVIRSWRHPTTSSHRS